MKTRNIVLCLGLILLFHACSSEPPVLEQNSFVFSMDNEEGNIDIYRMDMDTLVSQRLTTHIDIDTKPSISPNGQKIVFESNRNDNKEIYLMDTDGKHEKRLTDNDYDDSQASFSADSSRIVFISHKIDGDHLMIMDIETKSTTDLLISKSLDSPSFVNEDKHVLYSKNGFGFPNQISVLETAILLENEIENTRDHYINPILSPNKRDILLIRIDKNGRHELSLLNIETGKFIQITDKSLEWNIKAASFTQTGDSIIFIGQKNQDSDSSIEEVFTIDTNGKNLRKITENNLKKDIGLFAFYMDTGSTGSYNDLPCGPLVPGICHPVSSIEECTENEKFCFNAIPHCCSVCSTVEAGISPVEPINFKPSEINYDIPSITIGQTDYRHTSTNSIVPNKGFYPGGVIIDTNIDKPDYIYVMDSVNSRILGFDHLGYCSIPLPQIEIVYNSEEYAQDFPIENIFDGVYGSCNLGEYAAKSEDKTIELRIKFSDAQILEEIQIYDRACLGLINTVDMIAEFEDSSDISISAQTADRFSEVDLEDFDKGQSPVIFNLKKKILKTKK
ncbi:MAG: hypothetical protein KKF44_01975 [Nanoarchaeota archaeon]|nr:hypothetical protein [Nanoarchaeota archaeon]